MSNDLALLELDRVNALAVCVRLRTDETLPPLLRLLIPEELIVEAVHLLSVAPAATACVRAYLIGTVSNELPAAHRPSRECRRLAEQLICLTDRIYKYLRHSGQPSTTDGLT